MVTITGTKKIRGSLNLSGIQKELRAGDTLPISDEQFNDNTVQIALNMGMITYQRTEPLSDFGAIRIKNIYDRTLTVNSLNNEEIQPGQIFTLPENDVNNADIRSALAKGMLQIVSSVRPTQDVTEGSVRIGNLFAEDKQTPPQPEESENKEPPQAPPPAPEKNIQPRLETNEEVVNPSVINDESPSPVSKKDISDPKKASVIWNPTNDPIAHTRSSMEFISTSDKNQEDHEDVTFVDKEQESTRKESHPILKNKIGDERDGIDFL